MWCAADSRRWRGIALVCGLAATTLVAELVPAQQPAAKKDTPLVAGTRAGQEWDANGVKMKFCWCPPGKFTMGSPASETARGDDEDQVEVTISRGFWLGKYEVTQEQWQKLMGTSLREQRDKRDKTFSLYGEGASFPMYYVNHDEASAFCAKLTRQELAAGRLPSDWEYRLPTEAQSEYACRAGTTTATAFGDKLSSREANFDGNYPYNGAERGPNLGRTCEVGSYRANAWGLYDMHGNVWEWCRDWYDEKLPGGTDPEVTKEESRRVLRCGGWLLDGWFCRSAFRFRHPGAARRNDIGFRLAAVQVSK
jgi:sulfatase modifying factor 1